MSDTPRTDATVTGNSDPTQDEYEDLAFFARTLEREGNRLRAEVARLTAVESAARNLINYEVNGVPDFTDWDAKFAARKAALAGKP